VSTRHHHRRPTGRSRPRAAAVALAALVIVAAACGGDDDTADTPATAAGTDTPAGTTGDTDQPASSDPVTTSGGDNGGEGRVRGGNLTMVTTSQLLSHDPQLQRVSFAFTEGPQMSAIFGHLAYMDPTTGEVTLYFLESLEANDDFTTWTMKLHDGILFSDDTPLDAEAIAYNIRRAADPETGSRFQPDAEGLELEVLDALTLAVTLPATDANWDASLVSYFAGIGSPTAMEAAKAAGEEFGANPVGAGPFKIKEWIPGQTMIVERNPNFETFRPGQPYLDQITFENLPDQSQQVSAMTTGTAQLASPNGAGSVQAMLDADGVDAIVTYTSGGSNVLLNNTRPPFDDPRARRAVQLALDPVGAADAFASGTPPVTAMFSPDSPFYDDAYTFPLPDHEEAQRLFDELAAEGKPVEFAYTTQDSAAQAVMSNYLVGQFAQFDNVSIEIDTRTGADYITASRAGEYQMLPNGLYYSNPIPTLIDGVAPTGVLNSFGWDNAAVGEALERLKTIPPDDIAAQKEVWDIVQEEFLKDLPFYWVGQGVVAFSFTDDVLVTKTLNFGNYPLWPEVGLAE